MKGQLTGLKVMADQQVMARLGGRQPRPGIPALTLGALTGRTDLGMPAKRPCPIGRAAFGLRPEIIQLN